MTGYELVVLSADLDIEGVMRTLLGSRAPALGIRAPRARYVRHPQKDPGCFTRPEAVLGSPSLAERALVVFDKAFGGSPDADPSRMASIAEDRLRAIWGDRARAVVIAPEVEVWLWAGHHTAQALQWHEGYPDLRRWLSSQNLWAEGAMKPSDPKEAFRRVLARRSPGPSHGIFQEVALRASVDSCVDESFDRLRRILRSWFPLES